MGTHTLRLSATILTNRNAPYENWVTFHGSFFADHFWEPEGQLNRARKNQYLVPMPF